MKVNGFGETFEHITGVSDMIVFEEAGSKTDKNEYKICEVDENNVSGGIHNGNILIYSFKSEETKANSLLKLVQNKYIEQRTTIWINLIEMESEFHQHNVILNKRMPISMTNEFSEEK